MPVRLLSRRPSPTTVSFTVSNASRRTSTPARILSLFQTLLRALVFLFVHIIDIAKLRHSIFQGEGPFLPWNTIWSTPWGALACRIADAYSYGFIAVASAVMIYGVFRKGHTGILVLEVLTTLAEKMLISIGVYRRITPCHTWSWYSDVYLLVDLFIESLDEIHPYHSDTRHRHT
ncbi:hypothetical protein BDW42DRAFT_131825 [Aspergillus taichungensis]|uniref:Uncharacterized protein n=1 Tax=Aspergillus taichungensis TaxID=482145 RepID=A0A2J5I799_9EURO|nr:hypothetical protein BDW42DRAFT_131825 [Aspergillus taichungensis]